MLVSTHSLWQFAASLVLAHWWYHKMFVFPHQLGITWEGVKKVQKGLCLILYVRCQSDMWIHVEESMETNNDIVAPTKLDWHPHIASSEHPAWVRCQWMAQTPPRDLVGACRISIDTCQCVPPFFPLQQTWLFDAILLHGLKVTPLILSKRKFSWHQLQFCFRSVKGISWSLVKGTFDGGIASDCTCHGMTWSRVCK